MWNERATVRRMPQLRRLQFEIRKTKPSMNVRLKGPVKQ